MRPVRLANTEMILWMFFVHGRSEDRMKPTSVTSGNIGAALNPGHWRKKQIVALQSESYPRQSLALSCLETLECGTCWQTKVVGKERCGFVVGLRLPLSALKVERQPFSKAKPSFVSPFGTYPCLPLQKRGPKVLARKLYRQSPFPDSVPRMQRNI